MSRVSVRLPEPLHRALREMAQQAGVSMNSIVVSAVGEKVAASKTAGSLKARAAQGDPRAFSAVLSKVPDGAALDRDEIRRNPSRLNPPSTPPSTKKR